MRSIAGCSITALFRTQHSRYTVSRSANLEGRRDGASTCVRVRQNFINLHNKEIDYSCTDESIQNQDPCIGRRTYRVAELLFEEIQRILYY
jgi:hypothetical protein